MCEGEGPGSLGAAKLATIVTIQRRCSHAWVRFASAHLLTNNAHLTTSNAHLALRYHGADQTVRPGDCAFLRGVPGEGELEGGIARELEICYTLG